MEEDLDGNDIEVALWICTNISLRRKVRSIYLEPGLFNQCRVYVVLFN
jgi:hypothetical protein